MSWRPACSVEALTVRAAMLAETRAFFAERGVLEVQTAVLAGTTVTDPAIESIATRDGRFLQTSPEYQMKRLLAAGAPSIYQIGPVFRAGEQGRWHNPEFVMLEWYRLGFDDVALIDEVAALVDRLLGAAAYGRRAYADVVGVDPQAPLEVLTEAVGQAPEGSDRADLLDLLVARGIAALSDARVFVTDYPEDQAALARAENGRARRFELVVEGLEIANGYFELTDADELARRMRRDVERRAAAGQPVVGVDTKLLDAQRHGLPACAGVAVGFDRLVALRMGAAGLAEVMAFPADRA